MSDKTNNARRQDMTSMLDIAHSRLEIQWIYVLNHRGSPKWISAVVAKCSGPLSLVVKFPDGREACYHVDHVKAQATKGTVEDGEEMGDDCNPFAGEAEDDNDLVPNILIMVKEPAGCPRMDRRTTSTCST